MDEQFSAVIHVKQTMKRSNAPILTMIRNLWAISGCHEIILNVMCDVKLETIQNEINAFLSENITVTIVDNTDNCNSFAGYYSVRPMLKPVLHLTDEVVLLPSEIEFGFGVFKHYPTTISGSGINAPDSGDQGRLVLGPHRRIKKSEILGPYRTRTDKGRKCHTNSHQAVRGPGGAWIPD